jgi:hypothetical protein
MEKINLTCHIICLNSKNKKQLYEELNNNFNIIDLDSINQSILNDQYLDKLFIQFTKLKELKNDKFKEVDKKMSSYWENTFHDKLNELVSSKKKNIFIGMNNHYKIPSKKINLNTKNNFIVKTDPREEIKLIIANNLDNNRENIINGNFPLEYLDYQYLLKKREALLYTYIKNGYLEKSFNEILNVLKTFAKDNDKDELWISLKEPYNVNSKIHPQDKILYAYNDPTIALIESFNFNEGEIEKNITTENDTPSINLKEIKPKSLEKLKKKRFLHAVDKNGFMPTDKNRIKYFTQVPVEVKGKEKINNVYEYLGIN